MAITESGASERVRNRGTKVSPVLPSVNITWSPSAASIASDYIRTLIFDGVLRPGDRLPIDDVAEALSVSRQPVREALVGLIADGLVVASPRRGTYVQRFDAEIIREHFDLYGLLEARAAVKVTERRDRKVIARLRELSRVGRSGADVEAVGKASVEFFRLIDTEGSGPRLRALLRTMTRFVPPRYWAEHVPGAAALQREGLANIFRAIERGEGVKARDRVRDMWTQGGELLVRHLEAAGVFEEAHPDASDSLPPRGIGRRP